MSYIVCLINSGFGDGNRRARCSTPATHIVFLLDTPAPGTAFIATEGVEQCGVSVWAYLYGGGAPAIAATERLRWQKWLRGHGQVA